MQPIASTLELNGAVTLPKSVSENSIHPVAADVRRLKSLCRLGAFARRVSLLTSAATAFQVRSKAPRALPGNRASFIGRQVVTGILLFGTLLSGLPSVAAAGTDNYITHLQDSVVLTRSTLPTLTESAERAAGEFSAGGNLWVAGRQEDFNAEACGRAGGLMSIASLGRHAPTNHDIILYAVRGQLEESDLKVIRQCQENRAMVIMFRSSAGLFQKHFPLDTVANVIGLWTWTGEFVAACTRLGKMPVLYQSYGLPGGPERGKKYQGKKFHDDLNIKPISPGLLGKAYLDQIEGLLAALNKTQMPKILQAAQWWRAAPAGSATTLVTGHMFPRHGQDPRALPLTDFVAVSAWENKDVLGATRSPAFVLYLGYQTTPLKLIEQAKASGVKLVYTAVQPAQPPEPTDNILYLDPGWPSADGCVEVPGYDVPILPASGVIHAAIYWTLASERTR
jgi:hypothetical protein